jgi:Arc/MetJ family transcription regulator
MPKSCTVKLYIFTHTVKIYCLFRIRTRDISGQIPPFLKHLTSKINLPILLFVETAVTIDTEILNKAMRTAVGQTQRQLVEDALRLFVLQNKQSEARRYRGKLQWEGSLDELRTAKWSS